MPAPVPSRHSKDDTPVSALSRAQLLDVLSDLVRDLERLDLALSADGIEAARTLRDGLIGQVRDQVIPRLQDADVPSIVVVGGSTGAGKSTLVNSVLGQEVSVAGVLRPTTRTPVLVANPEDMDSLSEHPLTQVCRQEVSAAIPAGLALIDASDLDSVHEANRALAGRLLEAADLWLFVTTAARYGDQTPWTTLEEAARRETPIGVVLNRVPAKILPEVRRDLITRLQGLGLSEAPFFVVPDAGPHEGLLSGDGVSELRDWLQLLAGRHRAAGLVRRTGRGVWSTLRADLERLADDVDAQDAVARELERTCQELRETAIEALSADAERVLRDMAQQGNQLVFGTTFGYMEQMLKVAADFPQVKFEHATGYKTAANLGTYDTRTYEGAYMAGLLAGAMTQTGTLGVVASVPIPEVMRNINSFALGARSTNPKASVKIVWVNEWFNPPKETEAATALINSGADILMQNTDSSAVLQTAEKLGKRGFGWDSDMTHYGPKAHIASAAINWTPFYVKTIREVMDGTWKPERHWWGVKEGAIDLVSLAEDVPESARARLALPRLPRAMAPHRYPLVWTRKQCPTSPCLASMAESCPGYRSLYPAWHHDGALWYGNPPCANLSRE